MLAPPLDLRLSSDRKQYDPGKHYQGAVCKRSHDHGGFSWRHSGHGNCVDCTREGARRWKAANPERAAENTRNRDSRKAPERRKRWPIALVCTSIRARAKADGIPCDVSPDTLRAQWLAQDGKCFWTGEALTFDIAADRHPLKPSVDRLVPSLGYVPGNMVWASNFANRARNDCPADEFAVVMEKIMGERFRQTQAYGMYQRAAA